MTTNDTRPYYGGQCDQCDHKANQEAAVPLRKTQLEAVNAAVKELLKAASNVRSSGDQAWKRTDEIALHNKAFGIEYAVDMIRTAIEESPHE